MSQIRLSKGGVFIGLSYYHSLLFLLLLLAVLADLKTDRIPNGFLVIGIMIGLGGSRWYGPGLLSSSVSMLLAFLLMYPLFKIGGLGAGDIKVLVMTGGFLSVKDFLTVLTAAFVIGAILAAIKLFAEHNVRERLAYLLAYAAEVIDSKRWKLYGEDLDRHQELYHRNKIHFTVPILLGTALRIGGLI